MISNEEMAALTVADLLPMVQAATGPNYELERIIWHKLVFDPALAMNDDSYLKLVGSGFPAYTASLDAALALVERVLPDGYRDHFRLTKHVGFWTCAMWPDWVERNAPTPALALLAAMLKALIAREATPA